MPGDRAPSTFGCGHGEALPGMAKSLDPVVQQLLYRQAIKSEEDMLRAIFLLTPSQNGFFLTSNFFPTSNLFLLTFRKQFSEKFNNSRCDMSHLRKFENLGDFDLLRKNC